MFNSRAFENSRPDGINVLEIITGSPADSDQPRKFVPLKHTELKGSITGPLATMQLVQSYGYTREQCDAVLEAWYRFPLPGDAAVVSVRVCFGTTEIVAELKERAQAEADYQQAKDEGRQAALACRESPDVFTLQVAGIQPDQDIRVVTTYVQLAAAEGAGWSLRIPLTTAPRYVRTDELGSRHAQGQPLTLTRDPGHRFSLELSLRGASQVTSSTHRLEATVAEDRLVVRLREGEVLPDRDCVLNWKPREQADRPVLSVTAHDDAAAGQRYFLAHVAPPATHDRGRGAAREIILLVDHSGSMEGAKWQAADWAVERFLTDLTPRDSFALAVFHNTTQWFSPQPRAADATTVQQAVEFLKAHRDSGGTNLGIALEQALNLRSTPGDLARHVLIVTDAEVSDSGRILQLAERESQEADRRRLNMLCIDSAPNALLATELADLGGGVARFLTSQPDEGDITTALDEILADWGEPVLTGLRLEVDAAGVEAAGRPLLQRLEPGTSVIDLGDLPAGRPLWVAGRLPSQQSPEPTFRLVSGNQIELATCRVLSAHQDELGKGLKALFGARRIRELEYLSHAACEPSELHQRLQRLGYDPKTVLPIAKGKPAKVYQENAREEVTAALRNLLVREALNYGLASMETSFVAVRSEAGQRVEATAVVANALPAGWSDDFLSRGAATALCSTMAVPLAFDLAPQGAAALGGAKLAKRQRHLMSFAFAAPAELREASPLAATVVFSGIPTCVHGEAVLFDSTRSQDQGKLPDCAMLEQVEVRFPASSPDPAIWDARLCLLIYVDDLTTPRARVRLVDLMRQHGKRPLNLRRQAHQDVRLVLVDPAGVWSQAAIAVEVVLAWTGN